MLAPCVRTLAFICLACAPLRAAPAAREFAIPRREILQQSPAWFASTEARSLGERIVALQGPHGGWSNWSNEVGMTLPSAPIEEKNVAPQSLDDGASTTQIRIFGRLLTAPATPALPREQAERFRAAFLRGFDYLLAAQYPNGGWPHRFPAQGYHAHITFNDNTTYNVITVLRAAVKRDPVYAALDEQRRQRAAAAIDRGIACILACQVVQNGRKTAWGAQHDAKTLAPAPARTFEPASLCGHESVGVVQVLMEVERPSPEIIAAVRSAIAWFEEVKLTGIRTERFETPDGPDVRVVKDPSAPPLWARFYELSTNRPIFSGRDSVIKYSLAEIERERRRGYGWYSDRPRALLETDYPRWAAKWVK